MRPSSQSLLNRYPFKLFAYLIVRLNDERMARHPIKIVSNLYFYKTIIFVWIYLHNFYTCGIILLEFADLITVSAK